MNHDDRCKPTHKESAHAQPGPGHLRLPAGDGVQSPQSARALYADDDVDGFSSTDFLGYGVQIGVRLYFWQHERCHGRDGKLKA